MIFKMNNLFEVMRKNDMYLKNELVDQHNYGQFLGIFYSVQ